MNGWERVISCRWLNRSYSTKKGEGMAFTVQDRIKQGVELLDATKPGWPTLINLDNFDMGHPGCCVLGYAYGWYWSGINTLHADMGGPPYDYGFTAFIGESQMDAEQLGRGYDALTEAWRPVIAERKGNYQ